MLSVNHILLVEDDPDQSALFKQMLTMKGFDVVAVTDGETALSKLQDGQFDLLLSDWYLPNMNGDRLIAEVKKQRTCMKTILMSSHHSVYEVAMASGADGGIRKGDLRQLLTLITSLLAV